MKSSVAQVGSFHKGSLSGMIYTHHTQSFPVSCVSQHSAFWCPPADQSPIRAGSDESRLVSGGSFLGRWRVGLSPRSTEGAERDAGGTPAD